jgi:cation diffusion facilitator CzcD-associated flavoprotein CzcO
MTEMAILAEAAAQQIEHFDVVIVGADISGVGGAYHLTKQCPGTSFIVLEAQESFGGTWLTHRYPGTRSDSDLYIRRPRRVVVARCRQNLVSNG